MENFSNKMPWITWPLTVMCGEKRGEPANAGCGRDAANRGQLSVKTYANPVPSLTSDGREGQSTRTYRLSELMKSVPLRWNSRVGSAAKVIS